MTVSFACSDALSTVATCSGPVTVSSEGADLPVTGAATDRAGNAASASLTVRLDSTPPTCGLSVAGAAAGQGTYVSDVTVTVTATDALSGVAALEVSTGAGWMPYTAPIVVGSEGVTTVTCRATDAAGNPSAPASIGFTIDRTPPAVASTSPGAGAAGVPVTAVIAIAFSEPIVAGGAYGQITVLRDEKRAIAVTPSIAGSVLTLRPVAPLDRSRRYSVTIPGGAVQDAAGNALAAPYAFAFTTAK